MCRCFRISRGASAIGRARSSKRAERARIAACASSVGLTRPRPLHTLYVELMKIGRDEGVAFRGHTFAEDFCDDFLFPGLLLSPQLQPQQTRVQLHSAGSRRAPNAPVQRSTRKLSRTACWPLLAQGSLAPGSIQLAETSTRRVCRRHRSCRRCSSEYIRALVISPMNSARSLLPLIVIVSRSLTTAVPAPGIRGSPPNELWTR